jgi:hypothetical protein
MSEQWANGLYNWVPSQDAPILQLDSEHCPSIRGSESALKVWPCPLFHHVIFCQKSRVWSVDNLHILVGYFPICFIFRIPWFFALIEAKHWNVEYSINIILNSNSCKYWTPIVDSSNQYRQQQVLNIGILYIYIFYCYYYVTTTKILL